MEVKIKIKKLIYKKYKQTVKLVVSHARNKRTKKQRKVSPLKHQVHRNCLQNNPNTVINLVNIYRTYTVVHNHKSKKSKI